MSDLKFPHFSNEAEEAQWWFDNREAVSDQLSRATRQDKSQVGTATRLFADRKASAQTALPSTTIRLDPEDIAKARVQASERGLRYQTYLKMIIHEALRKAELNGQSAKSVAKS